MIKTLINMIKNKRMQLVQKSDLEPSLRQEILSGEDRYLRASFALRKDLTEEEIAVLLKDKAEMVRYNLTQNKNINNNILVMLSFDESKKVQKLASERIHGI
jgi:hypothetical protein